MQLLQSVTDRARALPPRHADALLVTGLAIVYAPLIFLGYGTDSDTYASLSAGHRLIDEGSYAPSRHPGYLLFEVASASLSAFGSLLSDGVSMLCSLVALSCLLWLGERWQLPWRRSWVALVGLNPTFVTAATSTMDYNWALALMLLGFVALEKRRPFGAAVLLGLAVGTRLSSFIFVITAYWTAWRNSKGSTSNLALSATISATIAIAFYVPSYAWAGYTFSFLSGHLGAPELWRPTMRLGRFVLRNVELVGLPFILTLGLVVTQSIWRRALPTAAVQSWIPIAALNIVGYELLYLKYPLDKAYLIPALPFAMLAVCHFIADRKVFRWALLGATILNGLVAVSFAKPDVKGAASQARFGIWLDAGELATDINLRWSTRHCATYGCVNAERNKAE